MPSSLGPTAFIILDGFGLADPKNPGNAITPETAPHIFGYMKKYPWAALSASGEDVGLFPGQQGNSEAGHITIGAGRVVKQDLVQISETIHDGTFFKNHAFKEALFHAKKYKTAVHIFALLTDGNSAHNYPEHTYAILEYFRREGHKKVFLHLFTDGRDSSPHQASAFLHELRGHMLGEEKIATIMGRFYAMDRNKIWRRTKAAYDAMVAGVGCSAASAEEAIAEAYNRGETDEFICPTVLREGKRPVASIRDNDVIFFMNARSDRARQLTKVFVQPDFEKMNHGTFRRAKFPKNTRFVALTDFGPDLPGIFTAFPSPDVREALAKVIGERCRQLYISESEKYAHITYFINGGYADPVNGEKRELIRSPEIRSYTENPEMQAPLMAKKIVGYITADAYDFICVNFPNADMAGHTGDVAAGKQAVRCVDACVRDIVEAVLARNGRAVIVGDHGNAERMINEATGAGMTEHSNNPVPCIVIGRTVKRMRTKKGRLSDVAPTLLSLLDIEQPRAMTGVSLV
jgi:2,3-bisphosphoglycerate-independent phosphoglycerate mutase